MKKQREYPLDIKISFHKIIEKYENQLNMESSSISREYIGKMLEHVSSFPKLTEGIETTEELVGYRDPIRILLKDLFPEILSKNEIKAISIPFHDFVFNSTKKFREILKNAGRDYKLSIGNLNEDLDYVFGCIMILNSYYGHKIDFTRSLYYNIPDKDGILSHYQIDFDWEFMEIFPTNDAKDITEDDVDELLQNIYDIKLWKRMFPPKSWIFKGFTIINLTDVTIDDAISDLKTTLLQPNTSAKDELEKFERIFKSIYKIPDLRVGFTVFDEQESPFEIMGGNTNFILDAKNEEECKSMMCSNSYDQLVRKHHYFTISNVNSYARTSQNTPLSKNLVSKGVKSAIFAPIAKDSQLLGVLELVSFRKNELNSINATKLEDILPYLVTAVERNKIEFENRVKAVIQSECTSIHPSVLWVFEKEARNFIKGIEEDGLATFKDIVFDNVYPLYGQIDIVASSEARNKAIQKDLMYQLKLVKKIINDACEAETLPIYDQVKHRIIEFIEDLQENLNASSEQKVFNLLQREVNPLLGHLEKQSPQLRKKVGEYHEKVNSDTGIIYNHRKNYDEAVQQINRTMSRYIDSKQVDAQKAYPHYFERYKTDGVDHNIYMGASLTNDHVKEFDKVYLYNIRLWQLSTMCEMENRFYQLQEDMPLKLEAASLILVFSNTLSIRYRMDEKKFDVDGTYNARYEIIKKRIDKACIKGTEERVSQRGKIAIVYSQRSDEREYLRYIKYLQSKKYLGEQVELLELEDVQGVIGLKAIRVDILYNLDQNSSEEIITYEDLMKELHDVEGDHK